MKETIGVALYDRFLRGLARSPRRAALRVGARRLTYEELHQKALVCAGSLLDGTPEPPKAVGVLMEKGVDAYVGILAALYTGAAVVPLHPGFPADRTAMMIEAAGVSALLADDRGLAGLAGAKPDLPVLALGSACLDSRHHIPLSPRAGLAEPRPVAGTDPAYLLFTSGSTGRPKGVPIRHGSTRHYFELLDKRYDFHEEDIFSQTFDLNFDCGIFDLFCAWGAGASVHPVPPHAYRDLPAFVAERAMTVWFSTPSAISLVRRTGRLAPSVMPTLRWSLFAGEALRARDAAQWQESAPRATVENIYGPTELTVTVTRHSWSPETSPGLCVNGLAPIGTVHEGHDHVLLGPDGEESGAEGELCVTGPQLMTGYLDPADNRGRFLRRDGRDWYRTGDRVRRLGNGELVYLGRLDAQVQIHGWRVEPAEVEHAVRGCAGVDDAVVVARTTDEGVELIAYHTGRFVSPVLLAGQLRDVLPDGMMPKRFEHLREFPLNSNRKIDRAALARAAAEGDREGSGS
ncbi:AMP-binding protein [Amycolatopsis samaneae]|uniref:AMP-binding protein n=1 Tax=Amycolatopsis samaneae TaxID=664691 RepID=A0ABW5GF12_9PSEU